MALTIKPGQSFTLIAQSGGQYESTTPEGTADPSTLPLADITKLENAYIGSFKAPFGKYGDNQIAFNPDGNSGAGSLFLTGGGTNAFNIGEIAIPTNDQLLTSKDYADIGNLPEATTIQSLQDIFADIPSKPSLVDNSNSNTNSYDNGNYLRFSGVEYVDGKLVVNCLGNYQNGTNQDGTYENNVQFRIDNPNDLTDPQIVGTYELEGHAHAAGWMSQVPTEWQDVLGGDYLTAHDNSFAILDRCSCGPAMYAVNSSDILNATTGGSVPTTEWIDYPHDYSQATTIWRDSSMSNYDTANPNTIWTQISSAGIAFIVPGTRTYCVLGLAQGLTMNLNQSGEQTSIEDVNVTNPTFGWTRIENGGTQEQENAVEYHFTPPYFGTLHYKQNNTAGYNSGGPDTWDNQDREYQYWLYDLNEVTSATNTYDPLPYEQGIFAGAFPKSLSNSGPGYTVVGEGPDGYASGAIDLENNLLFLASSNAIVDTDVQDSNNPVISVYDLSQL